MSAIFIVAVLGIYVQFAHWLADFICQTDWMALNKSKDWKALTVHAGAYAVLVSGWLIQLLGWRTVGFFIITFVAHWLTDFVTSRATSKLWFFKEAAPSNYGGIAPLFYYVEGKRHWFFVTIGFDQWLHTVQLYLTIAWLLR